MANLNDLKLSKHEDLTTYEVLPEGNHIGILASDIFDENGNLEQVWMFGEKQHKNWLNLNASNETAKKISRRLLKEHCEALGLEYPVENTNVLYGKPVMVTVVHNTNKNTKKTYVNFHKISKIDKTDEVKSSTILHEDLPF